MDSFPINMRRALTISSVVIVLLGAGVAVYFIFFRNAPSVIVTTEPPTNLPVPDSQGGESGPEDTSTATSSTPTTVVPRLTRISPGPVVPGMVVINRGAENASSSPETLVKFIERQSGNVFTYRVGAHSLTRTNNKTLPGIQSASWSPDGSTAFVRYLSGDSLSTINTYALPSDGAGGFFLQQNLAGIAVSSTSVLSLSSGVNGTVGSVSALDGTRPVQAFTTPLSSVRASFAGGGRYLVFTRPTSGLFGSAFLVDGSGRFSRISAPAYGLTALASPSGAWVLVSSFQNSSIQMSLINTSTAAVIPLPIATLADKCAWSPDESSVYCGVPLTVPANFTYPDDWYQGAVSFSDRIWKINVAGRYAQLVLDFTKEVGGGLDATALSVGAADSVLVFINKADGSLWSFRP